MRRAGCMRQGKHGLWKAGSCSCLALDGVEIREISAKTQRRGGRRRVLTHPAAKRRRHAVPQMRNALASECPLVIRCLWMGSLPIDFRTLQNKLRAVYRPAQAGNCLCFTAINICWKGSTRPHGVLRRCASKVWPDALMPDY